MKEIIVNIFKVIRRVIIAMTVNTNGIIKSVIEFFNVVVIAKFKAVEPLALDERMERSVSGI